jgi:hypothetical protein
VNSINSSTNLSSGSNNLNQQPQQAALSKHEA